MIPNYERNPGGGGGGGGGWSGHTDGNSPEIDLRHESLHVHMYTYVQHSKINHENIGALT